MLRRLRMVALPLALVLLPCGATTHERPAAAAGLAVSQHFDQFGYIRLNDIKARLDNLIIALQNEPGAHAYIMAYDGAECRYIGKARRRANQMVSYMNEKGLDRGRVVVVNAGLRENILFTIHVVSVGGTPPASDPQLDRCVRRGRR